MDLPRFTCQLHPATGLRMDLGMGLRVGLRDGAYMLIFSCAIPKSILSNLYQHAYPLPPPPNMYELHSTTEANLIATQP